MAIWRRHANSDESAAPHHDTEYGKEEYPVERAQYGEGVIVSDEGTYPDNRHHRVALKRGLEARHITMIAIGGAIGTGLIIGTGAALATAGPASIFISYTIIGFIVFLVMCALGEMATWLPFGKNFAGYASRYCDPCKKSPGLLDVYQGWR